MKFNIRNLFKFDWTYKIYQLWVINTATECNLYLWDKWCLLLPSLNSLVKLTRERAFIRTFQSYEYENKWLGFGRMKWNDENNIKWTTKYRTNISLEDQPEFFYTEIWAPDWNQVCDTGVPPDVFIHLYNYEAMSEMREGLIIAIPRSLYKKNKLMVDDILSELVSNISGANIYETKRDWWGRTALRNSIESITPQEIKKIIGY